MTVGSTSVDANRGDVASVTRAVRDLAIATSNQNAFPGIPWAPHLAPANSPARQGLPQISLNNGNPPVNPDYRG